MRPNTEAGAPAAGCTIVARNYLSYAAIVAESYLEHHPGAHFYVLVVDGPPAVSALPEAVHVLDPQELELPSFVEMCFKYDVTELCTAVKPTLLALLLERYGEPAVVYLDPDVLVLRRMEALEAVLASAGAVLVPHLLDPIPRDGHRPSEQDILIAGAYNLGFVAVRDSGETRRLLAWWAERLEDGCRVAPADGLFVDQRWMDLVPGLFPGTAVLRDPAYDVAYWNLHSRPLTRDGDGYRVGGAPLVFFHFSGFDPVRPWSLSKHQTRISVPDDPALVELTEWYSDLHRRHGHAAHSQARYGYARFSNQVPVNLIFRRLYLGLPEEERRRFGDAFAADGPESFFDWAVAPSGSRNGLSPFLDTLYGVRTDLAAAFPDVHGKDRAAFLEWARTQGAREMDYPPAVVAHCPAAPRPRPGGPPGVNVAGYLRNETGLGAVARGYVAALRAAGVPVALKDLSALSPNRSQDATLSDFHAVHPHPVNLVCVNADAHPTVAGELGGFFAGRRNIAVWHWELPEFPEEWRDRFAHYDEIWAPSAFVAGALTPVSPIPVVHMPPVLALEHRGQRGRGRARLGVAEGTFVWLFVFDLRSYGARKNPLGLVEAFARAFPDGHGVKLVLKCVNAAFDGETFAAMKAAARGRSVAIHEGYWSADEMHDLLAACDGYASLHRSEGLGVPLANAMWLGKPVVATGWSGNMDFMNAGNSFPVRWAPARLGSAVGPYRAGSTWAEPDIDHAAALMRRVVEGGPEVDAIAAAARRTIEEEFSVERVAARVRARLHAIRDAPVRSVAAPAGPLPAVAVPGGLPVLPRLDLDSSRHGWLGRLVKRTVAFLVRYHTFHQGQVNATLAAAVGELAGRVDALDARLDAPERDDDRSAAAEPPVPRRPVLLRTRR